MMGRRERKKQVWTEIRSLLTLVGTEDSGECTECSIYMYPEYGVVVLCIYGVIFHIPYDRKIFSMLSVSVVRSSDDKNKIMMNQLPV